MDIDMTMLRSLEREKEISFDILVEAIEQALLTAYHKTPGAQPKARVELDRKTGHVTVLAAETDDEGDMVREYDDTPEGFGRIAATTAKQIILQRLRDAEDDIKFGEFSGKEGDIVSGVIQQGRDPQDVMVDLGRLEALLPVGRAGAGGALRARHPDQVPGDQRPQGHARAAGDAVALSHPNLVKKLFALEVPEIADGTVEICGDRPRGRPPHQDRGPLDGARRQRQGLLHRPDGPAGPRRDERAARREDRHRRLVRGPGRDGRRTRCRRPAVSSVEIVDRRPARPAWSCPTTSCRSRSARRARTPASPPG